MTTNEAGTEVIDDRRLRKKCLFTMSAGEVSACSALTDSSLADGMLSAQRDD